MKKALCMLLCLAMVLSMVACGGGSDSGVSNPSTSTLESDVQDYITELLDADATISEFEEVSSTKEGDKLTVICDAVYGDDNTEGQFTLTYYLEGDAWELTRCSVELKEGGSIEADESEETEEVTEEEAEEPAETTEAATAVSEDWQDFTFEMDGEVYQLPCAYSVFADNGWTLDADYSGFDEDAELSGYSYEYGYLTNGAVRITVWFINMSGNARAVGDCDIGSITVEASNNVGMTVASGITCLSTEEEIKAAFGEPTSISKSDSYVSMTYEVDDYVEMEFYLYLDNASYNEITLKNCVASERDATTVSDERPDYLDDYEAPDELSDDPTDTMFKLDGKLYQLPCPLSEFTDDGWEVSYSTISSLGAGLSDYGYYLEKDGVEISLQLMNFGKNEVVAENCAVSYVEFYSGDLDGAADDFVVMAGGIDLGTDWSDIDEICSGWDRYDGSDGYYTLTAENDDYTVSVEYTYSPDYFYFEMQNEVWDY